ncbi:MAG TPA: UbiA family prenyltransferase [Candidatus Nanoarchaeia archaeon]|nr:UbiA family prenyltransferase [Candidatus Nanoarchaeia archaeon]
MFTLTFWRGLLRLLRPYWWGKTFFFFTFGAVAALGTVPDLSQLIVGLILIGPIFYGGLYILNDLSDIKVDKLDPEKKNKTFPSGMVSPQTGLAITIILISSALIFSFNNFFFFLCLIAMLINQLLYSFPPFRLKNRAFFDVLSTAVLSSSLKFLAGWFFFTESSSITILPLIGISLVQTGSYLMYKWKYNRPIDLELGHHTTAALLSEQTIKTISKIALACGLGIFALMSLIPLFFPQFRFLGALPPFSILIIIFAILATPFYWKKFTNHPGVFKIQTRMYNYYLLFTLLLLLLYWLN